MQLLLIPFFIFVVCAALYPGWRATRGYGNGGIGIFFIPLFSMCFWYVVAVMHIGPASLANLIELPVVAILSVVVAYIGFFVLRRKPAFGKYWPGAPYASMMVFVVLLRLLMPGLPE